MNAVETLFLEQLRSLILGEPAEAEKIDTEILSSLLTLSTRHSVTPLVAESLSRQGLLNDEGAAEVYRRISYLAFIKWQQQEGELARITASFEENKIPNIPLKGSVLRCYYPEPWMRTSSDIDILVHEEDLVAAGKMLTEKLGYAKKVKTGHDVTFVNANNVAIELHYGFDEAEILAEKLWETATHSCGSYQYSLLPEWFIFYHVAHMKKHFLIGGCGIRTLIDLYLILQNMSYDKELLNKFLLDKQLDKFFETISQLSIDWIEGKRLTVIQSQVMQYIIRGGAYGTYDNRSAVWQSKRKKNSFQLLYARIFLSKEALGFIYPIIRRYPVLYPFCQILRWIRVLRIKEIKEVSNQIKQAKSLETEVLDETADLLEYLGLSNK